MKAIILSAGQGTRLLPHTQHQPKCLLPVEGDKSVLEVQLQALARCGVSDVTVMVGFGAEQVERVLSRNPVGGLRVETFYNPFFQLADNLATVWLAQREMTEDFVLLNGDTLFDTPVLERLLASAPAPLTLAINEKPEYDSDDMKVALDSARRLYAVGKGLGPEMTDGESIGLMVFRDSGVKAFREALDAAVRCEQALGAWYLSVVDQLAERIPVETCSIAGLWWGELDSPGDLDHVRDHYDELRKRKRAPSVWARPGQL